MTLWQRLLALLAWASAEPSALEAERPRAAAAVAVAYASLNTGDANTQADQAGKETGATQP